MITTGTRLGPYEVLAAIGAGGMGEVYRARDSRLDRTVAIKVLPQRLSADPRFRERFEREAKVISSFSHPHICTLYDIGSEDGVDFLVMEYLEGESLAERLQKGPLPLDQVVRYGAEIAEALERAHRHGVVHRDLKPGNVILTKGGAKLLDFGLAKLAARAGDSNSEPDAATAAMSAHAKPLTEEGAILGTFQYMAPEQIEGREADSRTDIFALGALLYEMATGKRAFDARSRASLIASILDRDPPPISAIQPLTPPAFERVVRLCLAKDPDERWQSAHDVASELRWIRDASTSETLGPLARKHRRSRLGIGTALFAAGLVAGLIPLLVTRYGARPPRTVHAAIVAPPGAPMAAGEAQVQISPDGRQVAWVSGEGESTRVFIAGLNGTPARAIPGTERVRGRLRFSPDGRSIAFLADGSLKRLSLEGGSPIVLIPHSFVGPGLDWSGDTIYFARGFAGGIWSVPADGGQPRQIAKLDPARNIRALIFPQLLPGGKTILATAWSGGAWTAAKAVAIDVADGSIRIVMEGAASARYVSSGHLVFGRGGTLLAARFDPEDARVLGRPVSVVNGVAHTDTDGGMQFSVSSDGDLLYLSGGLNDPNHSLIWVGFDGSETPVVPTQRAYEAPVVSPDGRMLACIIQSSTYDIWLLDIERDLMTRVSYGGDDVNPLFSADGRHVYWMSSRTGAYNLYRAPTDGSGGEERITNSPHNQVGGSVSPDGRYLTYTQDTEAGTGDLRVIDLQTRQSRLLVGTKFNEGGGIFSPDGRWILYGSNESGQNQVYLRPFDGTGGKWQVSTDGATSARWSSDGGEIVYRKGSQFFTVTVTTSPVVKIGRPRLLFNRRDYIDYVTDPHEKRLLLVKAGKPPTATHANIVLGWGEELKRRVQ